MAVCRVCLKAQLPNSPTRQLSSASMRDMCRCTCHAASVSEGCRGGTSADCSVLLCILAQQICFFLSAILHLASHSHCS